MNRRYWIAHPVFSGFETLLLLYGTEQEMQDYMVTEMGCVPAYSGASAEELEACKRMGMKAYMC